MKFLGCVIVLLGIQSHLLLFSSVVSGCTYLSKNKATGGDRRLRRRGKRYNHQEGCYEHHGRLLQDDEVFEGTPEQALLDANDWIHDIHDDDDELGPKFVRLVFHDCVGGCDGCIAMSNDDNAGLEDPIEELEPLAEFYAPVLTRTDIWALAAVHFANMAGANVPNFTEIPFEYYGRPTCDSNVTDVDDEEDSEDAVYLNGNDHEMPSSHMVTSQLLDFFDREFNFTSQEVVAIMGAHTMGRLDEDNSGYDASQGWVFNHERLDNGIYRLLVNDGRSVNPVYGQEEHDAGFLWMMNADDRRKKRRRSRNRRNKKKFRQRILDGHTGGGDSDEEDDDANEEDDEDEDDFVMLNVDMALVLDLEGHLDEDGEADCDVTECPVSPLLPQVVTYAANETLFLNDFRDVLFKVTMNGLDICTLNSFEGVPIPLECLEPPPTLLPSEQPSASPFVDDVSTPTTSSPSESPIDDDSPSPGGGGGAEGGDGISPTPAPEPEEPCGIFRGRLCWQNWWE